MRERGAGEGEEEEQGEEGEQSDKKQVHEEEEV